MKCVLFIKETHILQRKDGTSAALDRLDRLRDVEAIMLR